MPDKELTSVQRYVLLTLMIKAAPLENPMVSNSLKADKRVQLEQWGYIEVNREKRPFLLELTQKGHDRAIAELEGERPERSGTIGLALYSALEFLRNLMSRTGTNAEDLFRFRLSGPVQAIAEPDAEIEERIRKAYSAVSARPGDYVMLDELRNALPDVGRKDLDAALIKLNLARDVSLVPESNQKVLTDGQRTAAVSIGNQFKHLIAIGV
ncbi:hypothetical protein HH310_35420 [Actinoplanes sp. TBRC 11911]|uniref:hypothetical protein n=1 Tax=Actinoplanes sp. TBRC 11911 TaxID=2729386 RepID=UPI00145D217F|nr:hypothetical protein [Actinoplanes sp. TBRC 11911]NMO56456.1 hypothetical protein [Actinoplanes sp. TBRC 11911]